MNYSDPLDILYMSAEGTFLRMLRKAADAYGNVVQVAGPSRPIPFPPGMAAGYNNRTLDMRSITNRNGIESIQYIENETLKERFMDCKKVIESTLRSFSKLRLFYLDLSNQGDSCGREAGVPWN